MDMNSWGPRWVYQHSDGRILFLPLRSQLWTFTFYAILPQASTRSRVAICNHLSVKISQGLFFDALMQGFLGDKSL